MKTIRLAAALAAATMLGTTGARATLVHAYEFTTDLSDAVAGGAALAPSDRDAAVGTVAGGRYRFERGAGLQLASQLPTGSYAIEISASLDLVNGYRKLVSFNDLSSDAGLYVLDGGLNLYPDADGPNDVVAPGQDFVARLTRDGTTGIMTASLNGVVQFSYTDTAGAFAAASSLWFLRDDTRQNGEDSAGSADYIRIYDDVAGTGGPVAPPVSSVPEPASWAMMVAGFGLVGGAARRRRAIVRHA